MTAPVRPPYTPRRRKSYAELSAEIDSFLQSVDLGEPEVATPEPPRPQGDTLLRGLNIDTRRLDTREGIAARMTELSRERDALPVGSTRRNAVQDALNAYGADYNAVGKPTPAPAPVPERTISDRLGELRTGAGNNLLATASRGVGGALRMISDYATSMANAESPSDLPERRAPRVEAAAQRLERLSKDAEARIPQTGWGVAGAMLGGALPYAFTNLVGGGVMAAAENRGGENGSGIAGMRMGARTLAEWSGNDSSPTMLQSIASGTANALGKLEQTKGFGRDVAEFAVDATLGKTMELMGRGTIAAGRKTARWAGRTFDNAMGFGDDLAQGMREGFWNGSDPKLAAENDFLSGERIALRQAEQAIRPLPRTGPTPAEIDAAVRRMERDARARPSPEKLNAAVDAGDEETIIAELDRLVAARNRTKEPDAPPPPAPTWPPTPRPQLDETGQQLDEANRAYWEEMDTAAQRAREETHLHPKVKAARDALNTALDAGDDRGVSRALTRLARYKGEGLYAAAPAGVALSQDKEDGDSMSAVDAALLAGVGAVAFKNGKRITQAVDLASDTYRASRDTARLRAQELGLGTGRFGTFSGRNLDDELDRLRAAGETKRADNMERAFGQSVVRVPVFHGTVANFSQPDLGKARADGAAGSTFYVTTNPDDASQNYAKANIYKPDGSLNVEGLVNGDGLLGPDLQWRFDDEYHARLQEAMGQLRYALGPKGKVSRKEIAEIEQQVAARALQAVGFADQPAGNVMPLYADVRNPMVMNGDNATFIRKDDWKEYAVNLNKAARAAGLPDDEITELLVELRRKAINNGGLTYEDIDALVGSAAPDFAVRDQIMKGWMQRSGFDAVILDPRRMPWGRGLAEGTMHIQLLDPNTQLKSATGNTGAFDQSNPDVRFGVAAGAGAAGAASEDGEHDSLLQAAAAAALVAGGVKWAQRYARPEQATKRAVAWVRKNAKNGVPAVQQLAKSYMQQAGVAASDLPRVRQVDPMFAKRVAEWYESVESDPTNPEVIAAYRAFADETRQQYDYLRSQGYTFEFTDENPYNSSAEMLRDVAENKRLKVFRTLASTEPDQSVQVHPVLTNEENDIFRAVHDFFGHAKEAHQFGPKGEENAYRVHSAMYSPLARRVMATETRGQNSWVNFHDKAAANRQKPGTVYADNKAALMPEELMGDYPDMRPVDAITNVEFKSESQAGFTNAEFKEMTKIERTLGRAAFISKVVEPIVRSENLPASVAKGLGSWFAEGDYAITEAARIELSKLPKYVIERALARVSAAAKQAGYFFAVPNPEGANVAVTLDFGKRLSEDEYKRVVETLSRDDGGATFQGTTMVRLAPGRMQTVLNEGADEASAAALVQRARELFPDLNVSGDVGRVDAIFRGGDTLDEALAQYAERIGVLGPAERRAQREAARNYERIASGARSVRSVLGQVDALLEGARAAGERGLAKVARGAGGAARPLAIGTALALTPSEAEGQDTELIGAAGDIGGYLAALTGLGAAGAGGRMALRALRNKRALTASGAERMLAEADALTNATPGNYTPNLQRVQRQALRNPITQPSDVDVNEFFRLDKASPDADKARMVEVVEQAIATSGIGTQAFDKTGKPVVGKPTITWDDVRREAEKLQIDPDRLIEAARQRGWTPAEALAGRTVIGENVNVMAALEQKLAQQGVPAEEKAQLRTVLDAYEAQTNRLLEVYMTERSAAGRLLNSYKIIANQTLDPTVWASRAYKAKGGDLTAAELATINSLIGAQDRAGLAKFVADMHRPSTGELFGAFFKAGLLMAPKTHITNVVSNALMTGMEMAKDAPAAAADRVLTALVNRLDPDKAGARRTKDFNPGAMIRASMTGARKGIEEAKKILRGESVENDLARWDAKGETTVDTGNPIANTVINGYLNIPFRLLSAGDRLFRQAAIARSIAEQQRILGTQAVTVDMTLQAMADAEFATFQQRTTIGEFAQRGKQGATQIARKGGPAAELAASAVIETTLPFVKTPAAVLSTSVEYAAGMVATPNDLAKLLGEARKGLKDPNQAAVVAALQKRAAERLGRQAVGALAITTGWVLAANGLLSAPIPMQDKSRRETEQMFGNTPGGALRVGDETTMTVDRISPLGNLLVAGASIYEKLQDAESPAVQDIANGVFSMGAAMLDNAFLQGVKDVQRATTGEEQAWDIAEKRAVSLVPGGSLLRTGSRMVDPTVRDPQTFGERVQAQIPLASRSLPAKRDPLGNPVSRPSGMLGLLNEVLPGTLNVDRSATDPQAKFLRELGATIGRPQRDKTQETTNQYREREALAGEAVRRELNRLQSLPSWNRLTPDEQRDRIEARVRAVRTQVTQRYRRSQATVPTEGLRPNVAGGGGGSRF